MEQVNVDPNHTVKLIKRLIGIYRKWTIDGVNDAEDKKNEQAGSNEQQAIIDEFTAQQGVPNVVHSDLTAVIRQFLVGGPTGDGDGPLVDNLPDDVYHAFAIRLSEVFATGRDLHEVFLSSLNATQADTKTQIAGQIYVAIERLGGEAELLSVFKRWCDTLADEEVLSLLRAYNAARAIAGPVRE
jgi:hypothetical protein